MLVVHLDRDSVHPGDDLVPHTSAISIDKTQTLRELLASVEQTGYLPGIAGGRATWVVELSGLCAKPVGVLAQEWNEPKLTVPLERTLEEHFGAEPARAFFAYWCQKDPELVFRCVQAGRELPSKF